jgi:integrase/recombinase XerD
MSGGPHGRGKAPERTCMKLADWPSIDRNLWIAALTPADPFAQYSGSRANRRPITNRNVERGYGRWLTFLSRRGALKDETDPAGRITAEAVRDYVRELDALGNKKNSILARLEELAEMAKVLGPAQDWRFIGRMARKVRGRSEAAPSKRSRLVGTDQLFALGLKLIDGASKRPTPLRSATMFRDGLIIALLALRPLRRRNLSELTIGRDLLRTGDDWTIMLSSSATKTDTTLEYSWPEPLLAALETYLTVHRPVLVARRGRWYGALRDRLWVSSDGSPFTQMGIYDRIIQRTRAAFGSSINPHLFRNAAATTVAIHDPVHVRLAAPLLGHRTFATTERSYIQAQTLQAHREFAAKLTNLRRKLLPDLEPDS